MNSASNEENTKRWPWENPIGVIKGYLEEPETPEIDPYDAQEREAIQWLENEGARRWNK